MKDMAESHKRLGRYIASQVFAPRRAVSKKRAFQLLLRAARSTGIKR